MPPGSVPQSEIPFPAEMCVVSMPGAVLQAAVAWGRRLAVQDPPVSSGGFLQADDRLVFDDRTRMITHVAGAPFDPARLYKVAAMYFLFHGIDNIVPFVQWRADNPASVPSSPEAARPAKLVLVEYFAAALLLQMGSFLQLDANCDGRISAAELRDAAIRKFGTDGYAVSRGGGAPRLA